MRAMENLHTGIDVKLKKGIKSPNGTIFAQKVDNNTINILNIVTRALMQSRTFPKGQIVFIQCTNEEVMVDVQYVGGIDPDHLQVRTDKILISIAHHPEEEDNSLSSCIRSVQ